MSSRNEVGRRRELSRSRSLERHRDRKDRNRDRSSTKHRSSSRDHKHKKDKKKSKKKKKRHSSSSSSSSDSEEEELKLLQRLEAERIRLKEEKQKQKEQMKASETPEEKRARRLREKQEKERKRRERMGWDNEYQCYTNQDNPFGDSALTNTFVWSKKLAKEGVKSVSHDELEALNRQKQLENKIELEKVKQRRLEREAERAEREAEAGAAARAREAAQFSSWARQEDAFHLQQVKQRRLEREAERAEREAEAGAAARAREAAQFSSWARQEDAFHLQQARLRSQIRIRTGRAKPIDLLAWYVSSEECVDALEMHEPYTYLNGLQMQDLDDLLEDITVYKELENNAHQAYWEDVQTIVVDELSKLRRLAAPDASARRDTVHQAVADDVTMIFKGKTGVQLEALREQIEGKISGRRDGVDVGYWESLLSQLKAHMARARLRERHQHNLRRKLQLLKQEQGVDQAHTKRERSPEAVEAPAAEAPAAEGDEGEAREEADEAALEAACEALYAAGRYSPVLLPGSALEPGTLLTEPPHDAQRLQYLRARLHAHNAADMHAQALPSEPAATSSSTSTAALELSAARSMGASQEEAQFSVEHALPSQPCLWADKYRPRKPRYFNRVHTGFEWNKYNQTHYDMDNPPPKIVQGYKFNIFYPDLIDKNATPEFTLKSCLDNPDFAVLRFHAGPPYEDIAFKIVNREWEYSYKRGFRCHFHNNIFQLWFHFKRYRYRR